MVRYMPKFPRHTSLCNEMTKDQPVHLPKFSMPIISSVMIRQNFTPQNFLPHMVLLQITNIKFNDT